MNTTENTNTIQATLAKRRVVEGELRKQGGLSQVFGRELRQNVADHRGNHRQRQGFDNEQKTHMGGRQSHRGVDGDLLAAFVNMADERVQTDKDDDEDGYQKIGHALITEGATGAVEIGGILSHIEWESQPGGKLIGEVRGLFPRSGKDGDGLEFPAIGHAGFVGHDDGGAGPGITEFFGNGQDLLAGLDRFRLGFGQFLSLCAFEISRSDRFMVQFLEGFQVVVIKIADHPEGRTPEGDFRVGTWSLPADPRCRAAEIGSNTTLRSPG